MARSYDIAEIMTSDGGLNEQVRRKINMNFRRVVEIATREKSASDGAMLGSKIQDTVESYVESILPDIIKEIEKSSFDRMYPVGCVIVTHTSSDPRLTHGKWEAVTSGKYVLTAGSGYPVGSTGGSNMIEAGNLPNNSNSPSGDNGTSESEQKPFMPEYIALLFYRRIS